MDPDFAHLTVFIAIAVLSGAFWHATLKSYCWAVVAAAITGAVVQHIAFGLVLLRTPYGFFWVVSLPICGVIAAAIGIPFSRYLTGSAMRLLGACATLFVLTVVVMSGLMKLAESSGEVFEFNATVAIVVVGAFMVLLLGGILAEFFWSAPNELQKHEEQIALAINGLPTSSTEAAAVLDGMPDTIIVHSRDRFFVLAFYVACAGIGALAWVARASNAGALAWGAALLFFGLCVYFATRLVKSEPARLVVTRDGFRQIAASGRRNRKTRWGEIDGYFWRVDGADESSVAYKRIQRYGQTHGSTWPPYAGILSEGSNIFAAELAKLLNCRLHLWRIAHGVDSARERPTSGSSGRRWHAAAELRR